MRKYQFYILLFLATMKKKCYLLQRRIFLEKIHQLVNEGKILDEAVILFVNDGSKDGTWELIKKLSKEEYHYKGLHRAEIVDTKMLFWLD